MEFNRRKSTKKERQNPTLCGNLNFAGSEAYKQLRTNIQFSIPKKEGCKVLAVTSAQAGDGKSTTSINLAYSLASNQAKVLLLEADMRLPLMAGRLGIKTEPGLSSYLTGNYKASEVIQKVPGDLPFYTIPAGKIPPNPSELLASEQMEHSLENLKKIFDYIIIDLPPVNIVTDASTLAEKVDGYIVVVRQDKTTRRSIDDALTKLHIVNAKILGFVLNGVTSPEKVYRSKYGHNYYSYQTNPEST